ncbi:MAG: hybrid sensor histidine kinase/response regulator [Candidatus Wallbacteria bacterium]|nr:hybrid sensor histidine kinase/response regulator [Candidatus Wallbacteria bacterium]
MMEDKPEKALVLVADDDTSVREVARRYLMSWGYDVCLADDGISAIDVALTRNPHVILLDVMMPRMTGFEALPRIRAEPSLALVPVVILTGLMGSEDYLNGIRLGADDYINKPFDAMLMKARVKSLVARETYRRQCDRLRRQFTAMILHDVRNPLTIINGFAELLLAEDPKTEPEFFRTSLQRIIGSAQRAMELVSQMLDFSQLQAGHVKLLRRREDVYNILHDVAEDQRLLATRKRIFLELRAEPGLAAEVDRSKLSEAVVNLVTNAIKFTPEGGKIVLEAIAETEGRIYVGVKDTGPGIPPDQIQFLFNPWQQAKGPVTSVKGYGLGLAIARMLVEAHGGKIELQSEIGSGSNFRFWIPGAVEAERLAA